MAIDLCDLDMRARLDAYDRAAQTVAHLQLVERRWTGAVVRVVNGHTHEEGARECRQYGGRCAFEWAKPKETR